MLVADEDGAVGRRSRVVRFGARDDRRSGRAPWQVDAHKGIGGLDRNQYRAAGCGELYVSYPAREGDSACDVAGDRVNEHQLIRIIGSDGNDSRLWVDDDAFGSVAHRDSPSDEALGWKRRPLARLSRR